MPDDLYAHDILSWSREQADRLRRMRGGERVNDLDWDNVIEEVESVGRSELRAVQSLFERAIEHALKIIGWPGHAASRHWRNEIASFLGDARARYEPSMAQHLDVPGLHARALRRIRNLDMRTRPGPLPATCDLTPRDLADPDLGPAELVARLAAALPGDMADLARPS